MGIYYNPGNVGFQSAVNSKIYIDKTGMLRIINERLDSEDRWICISRPRRFGKSIAARMLAAYYCKDCDSSGLFQNKNISCSEDYSVHLNQYDVIHLDINHFLSLWDEATGERIAIKKVVSKIQLSVIEELRKNFAGCISDSEIYLPGALANINEQTGTKFIIIIDEWDALFREKTSNKKVQEEYITLLRGLFKNEPSLKFIRLAYLTGILPIKKYGTQSALNNFDEFTMINPGMMAQYVGFTEEEVRNLCEMYGMDMEDIKKWYDGYYLKKVGHIFNPRSIVCTMQQQDYSSYWTSTETYETLKNYITANFDGLKDAIIQMLSGMRCKLNPITFQNDMTSMKSKDDIMTLLVHLGYLAYDEEKREAYIPNYEVQMEFESAVQNAGWTAVADAIQKSNDLLEATLELDADYVSEALAQMHTESASILQYHNENTLSCAITLAYYSAREYYTLFRELPRGRGFADMVFLPNKNVDKPALVVELKWNHDAKGAIQQIKEKNYTQHLQNFAGEILLVGINYDKKNSQYECMIEAVTK